MNANRVTLHGDDTRRRARALGLDLARVVDLASSLHPAAPAVGPVVAGVLDEVRHYPDAAEATTALACAIGVPAERMLLTNGASEAIALLATYLRCGSVIEPEFALYRRHLECTVEHADDGDARRWRSNPNNPLGTLASPEAVAEVWDEAFYPIATASWTRGDDASWRIGSLTKLWACPGLRLGYIIAPDAESCAAVAALQPRWAVNGLALAIVEPLLEMTDLVLMHRELVERRAALVELLSSMDVAVRATDANWVLATGVGDLGARLAEQGIFVRDCTSFGLPETIRIAVPTAAELVLVRDAMQRILAAAPSVGAQPR